MLHSSYASEHDDLQFALPRLVRGGGGGGEDPGALGHYAVSVRWFTGQRTLCTMKIEVWFLCFPPGESIIYYHAQTV